MSQPGFLRRRPWLAEVAVSQRFTQTMIWLFCLHTLVHLFGVMYLALLPQSLLITRRSAFGLRCTDVIIVVYLATTFWLLCQCYILSGRRWLVTHTFSFAILILSAVLILTYAFTLRQMDLLSRRQIPFYLKRLDRSIQLWQQDKAYERRARQERARFQRYLDN